MKTRKRLAAFAAVGTLLLNFSFVPAWATPKDPNLEQTVTADETIAPAGETSVLRSGHIDLGPIFPNAEAPTDLALLARDDTTETPVWRQPADVLFAVGNEAQQILPEGGAYDFTGKSSGEAVWALPQTQVDDVPWLGWNTQSPKVAETFDRGVTFEFLGHQGPGQFTVFLQAGGFGEPQVLWTSTKAEAQAIWVDLLTHTHANWVFTEPGIHLVKLRVKGQTKTGEELSAVSVLRFGVGDYDEAAAFHTQWDEAAENASADANGETNQPAEAGKDNAGEANAKLDHAAQTASIVNKVVYGSAAVGAVLIALMVYFILRGKKAQQAAFEETGAGK